MQITPTYPHVYLLTVAPPVPVRVRLADSLGPGEGRPEVFARGTWGTICDDEFDNNDAQVLCLMLGYK